MFRKYGFVGIVMLIFLQLNFIFKIQPFANWYFPLIWFSYILIIDAIVYQLKGNSLISNRFRQFLGIVLISGLFWWIFEFTNMSLSNWSYSGTGGLGPLVQLFGFLSFCTVLPALFETTELIRSIHIFDKVKLKRKHNITKKLLHLMIGAGVLFFFFPLILPKFTFPLIWLSLFLILDPINYLHKQPSVIGHLKDKRLVIPLSLLLAGIILGILWEFWNYWAIPKWTYNIPFVGFFKIFEMPILGYLGYFPFAFELYAMYWFVRSLFVHKEHLLAKN